VHSVVDGPAAYAEYLGGLASIEPTALKRGRDKPLLDFSEGDAISTVEAAFFDFLLVSHGASPSSHNATMLAQACQSATSAIAGTRRYGKG